MLGCGVQWGTVGEWVSGVAAAGAFGWAIWQWKAARVINARQAELVTEQARLIEEQRKEMDRSAVREISLVTFTYVTGRVYVGDPRGERTYLRILNGSGAPLRQVIIDQQSPPGEEDPALVRPGLGVGEDVIVPLDRRRWFATIMDASGQRWLVTYKAAIPQRVESAHHGSLSST